jgi:galactitol-specific phosphotransferase system IIC component
MGSYVESSHTPVDQGWAVHSTTGWPKILEPMGILIIFLIFIYRLKLKVKRLKMTLTLDERVEIMLGDF